ncbi:MAG: hypothetical protein MZV70_05375 [Desulfobacterales bacterium]|nr:hypothetical protein [Desulfobacterales bacterium]
MDRAAGRGPGADVSKGFSSSAICRRIRPPGRLGAGDPERRPEPWNSGVLSRPTIGYEYYLAAGMLMTALFSIHLAAHGRLGALSDPGRLLPANGRCCLSRCFGFFFWMETALLSDRWWCAAVGARAAGGSTASRSSGSGFRPADSPSSEPPRNATARRARLSSEKG